MPVFCEVLTLGDRSTLFDGLVYEAGPWRFIDRREGEVPGSGNETVLRVWLGPNVTATTAQKALEIDPSRLVGKKSGQVWRGRRSWHRVQEGGLATLLRLGEGWL